MGPKSIPLTSLFQIKVCSFVKCNSCKNRSDSPQIDSEIQLCVNNPFSKQKFSRLETSLLNNLKIDHLTGSNQYQCEVCKMKKDAQKASELIELPDVLVFNVNRFVFDLATFMRVKVNDVFEFPLILDMNSFFGEYSQIKNNLKQKHPEFFVEKKKSEKKNIKSNKNGNKVRNDKLEKKFKNIYSKKKGKRFRNMKTSSKTRSFLRQQRKNFRKAKAMNQDQNEDEFFLVGNGIVNQNQKVNDNNPQELKIQNSQNEIKNISQVEKSLSKIKEKKELINEKETFETKLKKKEEITIAKQSITNKENETQMKNSNPDFLSNLACKGFQNESIKLKNKPLIKQNESKKTNLDSDVSQIKISKNEKKISEKEEELTSKEKKTEKTQTILEGSKIISTKKKMNEEGTIKDSKDPNFPKSRENQQFREYFKNGPHVYSLYAVFIHKGSAYQGHYYIYIKCFESGIWFQFDDSQVTEVNIANMLKDSFGGRSSNSGAYMLAYRKVKQNKNQISNQQHINIQHSLQENQNLDGNQTNTKSDDQINNEKLKIVNETASLENQINSEEKSKNIETMQQEIKRDMSFNNLELTSSKEKLEALEERLPQIERTGNQNENSIICPPDLKALIMAEIEKEKKEKTQQIHVRQENAKILRLKVHFRLEVRIIAIRSDRTFLDFKEIVFKRFGIGESSEKEKNKKSLKHNFRIRMFDRLKDEMLDDFYQKQHLTLKQLKIIPRNNFIIEEKQDHEDFERFDPSIGFYFYY